MAAMITLAARAALATNAEVIRVLRLVGARTTTSPAPSSAASRCAPSPGPPWAPRPGLIGVAALPAADAAGGFLTGLGFTGSGWLWPFALPPLAAIVAFAATRRAAFQKLRELT